MSSEPAVTYVIDVYTDTVPAPRQRSRDYRPMPLGVPHREHEFRTPDLSTPLIERQSSWAGTALSRDEVVLRAQDLEAKMSNRREATSRLATFGLLLDWLETFPGQTWQQRWLASGADQAGAAWADLVSVPAQTLCAHARSQLTGAAGRLVLLGVLRPAYNWLYRLRSARVLERFRALHDPEGFAALDPICERTERFTSLDRNFAYHQLTRILMHNGGRLADITVADCIEAYRAQVGYAARQHGHWYLLLAQVGVLPADSPPTIWAASRRGQLSVEELVDGYGVACRAVRDLMVDYLHERQATLDYSSLRQLATKLVLLFWRDIELHEPGIDSLHLSDEAARRWKERLRHIRYGNHGVGKLREDPNTVLMAVRALYADLAAWALEDPGHWAAWAAPNPVNGRDLLGQNKQRKRATARMHQRIRELAPVLPSLVATAERRLRHAQELLAAAARVSPCDSFEVEGERLHRLSLATDPARGGLGRPGVIYASSVEGGRRRNLTLEEDLAFWAWAVIEVLRHSGVRIEELLELTHRSFVAYSLPTTGEVIPLLQITPSKTDQERLLVVSPELAEVLTAIISRVRGSSQHLPLVTRYDHAERLHSPPLPFLFQRPWGLSNHIMTHHKVRTLLDATVEAAGLVTASGQSLRFGPHDFRRIFATEAVASGLPVHIAAKLLGHENLATTQAYIAVYDQDVIDHHRAFIARRRSLRPSGEYREPTDAEWDEFLGHFERRKVELGVCGRAYGTPCQHEHACIRCPMLRPDPNQIDRLSEIIDNLRARLAEAHQHGWLGEVEGLEASLAGAEQKLAAMRRPAGSVSTPIELRPSPHGRELRRYRPTRRTIMNPTGNPMHPAPHAASRPQPSRMTPAGVRDTPPLTSRAARSASRISASAVSKSSSAAAATDSSTRPASRRAITARASSARATAVSTWAMAEGSARSTSSGSSFTSAVLTRSSSGESSGGRRSWQLRSSAGNSATAMYSGIRSVGSEMIRRRTGMTASHCSVTNFLARSSSDGAGRIPQQRLTFWPLPQGHGWLRPTAAIAPPPCRQRLILTPTARTVVDPQDRERRFLTATPWCREELGHVLLHDDPKFLELGTFSCRGLAEVEAESVAYLVCATAGLSTGGYSFPYVARWANGDVAVVRSAGERALGTARVISHALGLVPAPNDVATEDVLARSRAGEKSPVPGRTWGRSFSPQPRPAEHRPIRTVTR